MPRRFRSPLQVAYAEDAAEFFVPAAYPKSQLAARGDHDVNVVARLRSGVTVAAAQAALEAVSAGLRKQFPRTNGNLRAVVAPLADDLVHKASGPLWILLAASGVIVLITCVNMANLMLVRAVRRQHESSVRMALGAGRWGLVRQYLAESLVVTVAGCAAGMALGLVLMKALVAIAPSETPRLAEVTMDWRVFMVAAAVAAITGVVFGMVPAWQASRAQAAEALKSAARSTGTKSQARWRATLTTAEVALSFVLLVSAGLLLRSFMVAMGVDLGFRTERVLAMNVNLPDLRYKTAGARFDFFRQLEDRVKALPGVEAAAFANRMPMRGGWSTGIIVDTAPDENLEAGAQAVSTGYFETLGIPLLRGRALTLDDREGAPVVAIVNREFARRYMQDRDPVGHRLLRGKGWCRIVGEVNDIRRSGKLDTIKPQVYFAAAQTGVYPVRLADFAIRSAGDPRRLVNAIQQQVWALDREQPVTNVRTMEEIVNQSVSQTFFEMVLLLAFAGVATLLATTGIFGVLSYLVSQRMSELGIRLALGASPRRIVALVLGRAGVWIGTGLGLGMAGAFALTHYLEALLFQVKRTDPWSYAGAVALLTAVSLAAALLPALRGSRADPATALRAE
jgi:putative ABC transport system permease protein